MMPWKTIGFWAGVALPLCDIPLIVRVIKRKSSEDISLWWALGLWVTAIMMTPCSFLTKNMLAIGFNLMNVLMLSVVCFVTLKYRQRKLE